MFRFHETTRKRVCRMAFVMLCVAPTFATLAWIGWRRWPGSAAYQSSYLSDALHGDARLAGWQEPRPGLNRTGRLTLLGPGDSALVEISDMEVQHGSGALRVDARSISLDADGLGELTRRIVGWLTSTKSTSIAFTAGELAVSRNGAKDVFALHDLQVRVDPDAAGGWKAQLSAQLGNYPTGAKAVRVTIQRTAQGEITGVLDANEVELPCWLVAAAVPMLAGLNGEALFSGILQLNSQDGELHGVAQGQVTGLAIQCMLPLDSPHKARGSATVSLLDLHWENTRIESISASVRADSIELSSSVVDAAVRSLFCKLASTQPTSDVIAIDQFACRFQFDHRGLMLTGELGEESSLPQGCLASSQGQLLLIQPQYPYLHTGQWVQFLAAPASGWVPATQEAVEIAERLPLPTR